MLDLYAASREQLHAFAEEIKSRRIPVAPRAPKLKVIVVAEPDELDTTIQVCSKCKVAQPLRAFLPKSWGYKRTRCNSCIKAKRREYTEQWAAAGLPNAIRNLKILNNLT